MNVGVYGICRGESGGGGGGGGTTPNGWSPPMENVQPLLTAALMFFFLFLFPHFSDPPLHNYATVDSIMRF